MTVLAAFDVIGIPKPQGSKRAYIANGKARTADMGGVAGANWRDAVATAARNVANQILRTDPNATYPPPFEGPLQLSVGFRFPMPKSRPQKIRERGEAAKTTAPDLSKLVRSLEDGLQAAGLIRDDACISTLLADKIEVADGWTGATIKIVRGWTA